MPRRNYACVEDEFMDKMLRKHQLVVDIIEELEINQDPEQLRMLKHDLRELGFIFDVQRRLNFITTLRQHLATMHEDLKLLNEYIEDSYDFSIENMF
jgi:hypothetical protein